MTRERLKTLLAEYGRVAIFTYLGIFVLVLAGFTVAISAGFQVDNAASAAGAGTLGIAYLATKLTQPIRIAVTLAVTPLVAQVVRKFSGQPSAPPAKGEAPPKVDETRA